MQWDRNYTSSEVDDRRGESMPFGGGGMGGGGVFLLVRALSIFGWKGILVGLIIAAGVATCGQCSNLVSPGHGVTSRSSGPVHSSAQENEAYHFVSFVFDDVQRTWRSQLPGYTDARLEVFRRALPSACGTAQTAIGPFYCPRDQRVYLDLSFFDELANKLGAPGQFAEAYVVAHELGHHVQKLAGILGERGGSVEIELQADCLAGAWAKDADRRHIIDPGDIDQALNAASQIGDDTLQRKTQGYVQPETFTHGTSAQRRSSFQRGFTGGAAACGIQTSGAGK